jgi:hypothetical protein
MNRTAGFTTVTQDTGRKDRLGANAFLLHTVWVALSVTACWAYALGSLRPQ